VSVCDNRVSGAASSGPAARAGNATQAETRTRKHARRLALFDGSRCQRAFRDRTRYRTGSCAQGGRECTDMARPPSQGEPPLHRGSPGGPGLASPRSASPPTSQRRQRVADPGDESPDCTAADIHTPSIRVRQHKTRAHEQKHKNATMRKFSCGRISVPNRGLRATWTRLCNKRRGISVDGLSAPPYEVARDGLLLTRESGTSRSGLGGATVVLGSSVFLRLAAVIRRLGRASARRQCSPHPRRDSASRLSQCPANRAPKCPHGRRTCRPVTPGAVRSMCSQERQLS